MRSAFAKRTKHLKRISSGVHIAFWKPALLLLSKENEAQLFFEKKKNFKKRLSLIGWCFAENATSYHKTFAWDSGASQKKSGEFC